MNRTFDWVSKHDERSRNYGIRALNNVPKYTSRSWVTGSTLDQGYEGACVGFAWTAELLASPRPNSADSAYANLYAKGVYRRAKQIDEWAGESYEGTSVLAGAKVLKERGLMDHYRWCFGIDDVRLALLTEGPVVIGINWYEGMYETRPSGLVEVGGRLVGGHALTLVGYNPRMRINGEGWFARHEVYKWKNSWGQSYGKNGQGLIKAEDLATLLGQQGEACVPIGRKQVIL